VQPLHQLCQVGDGRQPHRRVLVVGHYASEYTGGAGAIPLRVFGRLRAHGVDAWLLTHVSARAELAALLPAAEFERITFVSSLPGLAPVYSLGERLPVGLRTIAWAITQLERQVAMLPVARRLVRELAIDVVHQPISVSPVSPSPLAGLGVPVVMGPLNGGMQLPPAFRDRESSLDALIRAARPILAAALNQLIRGRPLADVVLVANDRTRSLLPRSVRKRAIEMSDIGVVLRDWPAPEPLLSARDALASARDALPSAPDAPPSAPGAAAAAGVTRFLFAGRLVGWKGVDLLLDAFARVRRVVPARLEIVGDGPERARLAARADGLGCRADVALTGWLDPRDCARRMRSCDVFVSPSLQESGGVAVLEAMASARPVIAAGWGGHLTTVDETVGILVGVSSRAAVVRGLADAMIRLAGDPGLRARLGAAGRRRVEARYDWDLLVRRTLGIYDQACAGRDRRRPHRAVSVS
jgi:glycosyltransferase involved in cell wall biosynthesis